MIVTVTRLTPVLFEYGHETTTLAVDCGDKPTLAGIAGVFDDVVHGEVTTEVFFSY